MNLNVLRVGECVKALIKGAAVGVLFWSSFFWTYVFSCVTPVNGLEFLIPFAANAVIGLLLADKSYKQLAIKFAISIPFGVITLLYYLMSNFLDRMLNIIFPDYGDMSAGGGFALLFIFATFFFLYIIAIGMAFLITTNKINKQKNNPSA